MGRLGRPWGLKGAVLLHLHNLESHLLDEVREVVVAGPGVSPRPARLVEVRPHGRQRVVRVQGVVDPDGARLLAGLTVSVPRAALPAPEEGEWYVRDLVGCQVQDDEGRVLGTCTGVFPTGANEVLVIGEGADERYVALVDEFIESIDVAARLIRVRRWEEI
ncbi:ribosome maturation factor RimM [Myxococcota bacterium]|nr:ribosome maturation factor RimM [Myxococcota bacterium]